MESQEPTRFWKVVGQVGQWWQDHPKTARVIETGGTIILTLLVTKYADSRRTKSWSAKDGTSIRWNGSSTFFEKDGVSRGPYFH